jgi:hypothetical protein
MIKAFFVAICINFAAVTISFADEFTIDKYSILVDIRQDGNVLKASGRVRGPTCKLLRIDIFVTNENGYLQQILIGVKNVDPGGRLMEGSTPIYRYGNRWDIMNIFAHCAQM